MKQLYYILERHSDSHSIDVVAKKHAGGRGQAFIVFAEQAAATTAMRNLSGESFYSQSLVSIPLTLIFLMTDVVYSG